MGKRVNIGIYIGPNDTDIAAWFNLLQANGMSRSKWVRGLFTAYMMDRSLPIGTVNINAPLAAASNAAGGLLFGVGSSQGPATDKYGYGWQIRGPNREFIYGSVINVSISKDEILPVIDEIWSNGHQLATFLKALIRKNLSYGQTNIPPDFNQLQILFSDFVVNQATKKISDRNPHAPHKKKQKIVGGESTTTAHSEKKTNNAMPQIPFKSQQQNLKEERDAKSFTKISFNQEPSKQNSVQMKRNPLLDKI